MFSMPKTKLLIVESPAKARTINRFLGSEYKAVSCMGHIRDLPESAKDIPEEYKQKPWKNLGVNVEKNFEPIYCIPKSKIPVVKQLKQELKQSKELILATDEDREGEGISWHLLQVLKPKIPVKRIVFHEITKKAIQSALKNYRSIDMGLVQAQEARRILDRLVGYTISPLLWKKITTRLSAGRVQSTAVRLLSEREIERMNFVQVPYFHIEGEFCPLKSNKKFSAFLYSWETQKIAQGSDFDSSGQLKNKKLLHLQEVHAEELIQTLEGKMVQWEVQKVEKKPLSIKPKPPFITSTLQQDASRKLGLAPRQAMSIAQKLYENGFITYMRTDSVSLSNEALSGARKAIALLYGKEELPASARGYKTKTKGAQEAHEAIRPAGGFNPPEKTGLSGSELSLYRLIWQRTLASQMKNCEQEQTRVEIKAQAALFAVSGSRIVSPGFYRIYREEEEDSPHLLPPLKKGDRLKCLKLSKKDKQTQPPFRYNEASLIQKLEKEGIGRPSTYAPIISTIQDRGYAIKKDKSLAPTFTALAITKLLSTGLPDYVDLGFTSKMEGALDDIALGKVDYIKYLSRVYKGKKGLKIQVKEQEKAIDGSESRVLHFAPFKGIDFNIGRFGPYITKKVKGGELKSSLPEDLFLSDITLEKIDELFQMEKAKDKVFGRHPKSKKKIFVKTGRYGPYLELEGGEKRVGVPSFLSLEDLDLERAVQLLELPKVLGRDPKTGREVRKSIGRFGPYVAHEKDFRSAPSGDEFFALGLEEALELLAQKKRKRGQKRAARKPIKEFTHNGETFQILMGFSPYVRYKNKNYSLPKGIDHQKITLKEILNIVAEKSAAAEKRKQDYIDSQSTASLAAAAAAASAGKKPSGKKPSGKKSSGKKPASRTRQSTTAGKQSSKKSSGKKQSGKK